MVLMSILRLSSYVWGDLIDRMHITHYTLMNSTLGEILLAGDAESLSLVYFIEKSNTQYIEPH